MPCTVVALEKCILLTIQRREDLVLVSVLPHAPMFDLLPNCKYLHCKYLIRVPHDLIKWIKYVPCGDKRAFKLL